MRMAEFILTGMENILTEWESFAATLLPAASRMTPLALRDHARQILEAVAKDLQTDQTKQAQTDKSQGKASPLPGAPETAAQTHALLRAKSGFDINQLVAEYRALRASVLRLWIDTHLPQSGALGDVIRFNEAIDQAISESITFFHDEVELSRKLLLGMLGHDMRNPLNTILMTASYLAAMNAGDDVSQTASRLLRSGTAIKHLLDDLVDFNRTQLGLGINIARIDTDLAPLVADEVQQFHVSHPDRRIEMDVSGDTTGRWDGRRLQQLLRNLISNALRHGAAGGAVRISLIGGKVDVVCEVSNSGTAIEQTVLERMFHPLEQGLKRGDNHQADESLGLGLYIVREIARGHGGEVTVRSREDQTIFTVRLPRGIERAAN